jgi:hypothetical protein
MHTICTIHTNLIDSRGEELKVENILITSLSVLIQCVYIDLGAMYLSGVNLKVV